MRQRVYLYFSFWFSFLERCNGKTRGRERKNMLAQKKKTSEKDSGELSGLVLMHVESFSFYQAHSREDYRHRGITILKLLQPGSDLQPVMEKAVCHRD